MSAYAQFSRQWNGYGEGHGSGGLGLEQLPTLASAKSAFGTLNENTPDNSNPR